MLLPFAASSNRHRSRLPLTGQDGDLDQQPQAERCSTNVRAVASGRTDHSRPECGRPLMADELTLYTHPMSRGRIVRWMLEEVGAAYDTQVVDYGPAMKSAEYLAINPMGKVPAIRHGDTIVTECAAICAYLADAFPRPDWRPHLLLKDTGCRTIARPFCARRRNWAVPATDKPRLPAWHSKAPSSNRPLAPLRSVPRLRCGDGAPAGPSHDPGSVDHVARRTVFCRALPALVWTGARCSARSTAPPGPSVRASRAVGPATQQPGDR